MGSPGVAPIESSPRSRDAFGSKETSRFGLRVPGEGGGMSSALSGPLPPRFFALLKSLTEAGKVVKSVSDKKWAKIQENSRNWYDEKDQ